jgi:hypothetical protein
MKPTQIALKFVPTLMTAFAVISMIFLFQLDAIVHQRLYSYGLQFSYDWATPYWTTVGTAFTIAWVTIAAGIGFQIVAVVRGPEKKAAEAEVKQDNQWSTYKLRDGSTIKVKHVLKGVRQLPTYAPDGAPMYSALSDTVVQVVEFPEELRRKPEEQLLNLV